MSANAGEEPKPLDRIASGGELSRVALALKTCASRPGKGTPRTLVFDEMDAGVGGSAALELLEHQPAPDEDQGAEWEEDYEQRLFSYAAQQVRGDFREATWQAFWRTAVDGEGAKQVAEALGMSVGAVYIAKSRVLARLREQIEELQVE